MRNLTEISKAVAKMHGMTNAEALAVTRTVFDAVKKGITELTPSSRDRVSIAGLGNFGVKTTSERTVRNIKTGDKVPVPAGKRVTFKPAEELKGVVASGTFEFVIPEKPAAAEKKEDAPKKPARTRKAAPATTDEAATAAEPTVSDIPDLEI